MALDKAGVNIENVDLISYSAGPGLGPCLRVGAVVARTLASFYDRPLVAANHALGHIELGKLLCKLNDPLVLIVSGGHTALTANACSQWKIFGETLDLTLGQLIDQLGRFLGLSSPAGPEMEELAIKGATISSKNDEALLGLPYTIKGNDVSYSGLLSAAKMLYHESGLTQELLSFAVQEMAFSILTEATERALAFTGKKELLLTGGVAANQRLGDMLSRMCSARDVRLGIIPRHYAGDCGAQIAAAGITLFENQAYMVKPERAFVRQAWRLDQVKLSAHAVPPDQEFQEGFEIQTGAEAKIELTSWHERKVIKKTRLAKSYRDPQLDDWLRNKRTREEAEILYVAKTLGVDCPLLFFADPLRYELYLEYIEGIPLRNLELSSNLRASFRKSRFSKVYDTIGRYIARMHSAKVIHGDLTTKNVVVSKAGRVALMDFGLSFRSERIEDMAEDLHLIKQALLSSSGERRAREAFELISDAYMKTLEGQDARAILKQMAGIERRGRYARLD